MSDHTPPCPWCRDASNVEPSGHPSRRWWCVACNLTFAGGQGEWEAEQRHIASRDDPANQQARDEAAATLAHLRAAFNVTDKPDGS